MRCTIPRILHGFGLSCSGGRRRCGISKMGGQRPPLGLDATRRLSMRRRFEHAAARRGEPAAKGNAQIPTHGPRGSATQDEDSQKGERRMTDLPVPVWRFPCPHCGNPVDTAEWEPDDPCVGCRTSVPAEPKARGWQRDTVRPLILARVRHLPDGYSRWEGRCPHCHEATVGWFFATDGEAFRCPSCGGTGYTALIPFFRTPPGSPRPGVY